MLIGFIVWKYCSSVPNWSNLETEQHFIKVLDRLDLDTDKPSDEDLAKKFGYEDDYYSGKNLEKLSCFDLKRWMI